QKAFNHDPNPRRTDRPFSSTCITASKAGDGMRGPRCAADIGHSRRYMSFTRLVRVFGVGDGMSERSSDGLDVRRRKLLFRSWHRGMREMDLIMGRFADNAVAALSDAELDEFERLIDVPDRELLAWVTGEAEVPCHFDTPLFRRMRDHHRNNCKS